MTLLPRCHPEPSDAIELYGYHEDDVFTMTDEEENEGTNRWPSKENIVGLSLTTCSGLHAHPLEKSNRSCGAWTNSCTTHRPRMRWSSTVSFYVVLPSLAHRVSQTPAIVA